MRDNDLSGRGWAVLRQNSDVLAWAKAAEPAARAAMDDPANAAWYRCMGTWFAGVDCLPNDVQGAVGDSGAFPFHVFADIAPQPLHPGQVSAVFPGYPQPMDGESGAAARFRRDRFAAHVDGLLPVGPERRRKLQEPHMWILGVPVTKNNAAASPLVVWDGSHLRMQRAFARHLNKSDPATWQNVDLTEVYHSSRREVFEHCEPRKLPVQPGDAVLVHRLALHGIAPWAAPDEGPRIMIYFRPEGSFLDWVKAL